MFTFTALVYIIYIIGNGSAAFFCVFRVDFLGSGRRFGVSGVRIVSALHPGVYTTTDVVGRSLCDRPLMFFPGFRRRLCRPAPAFFLLFQFWIFFTFP